MAGVLTTFRTKYYPNIIELIPQMEFIKEALDIAS